jgi:ABC-2 type transport system ATP-binding protein
MSAHAVDVSRLTKRYGGRTVVDDLSFAVPSGAVTGFLGPNGAGKTTTLRVLLGLAKPDEGSATILGRHYAELEHPGGQVGALLETSGFHPGRTGADHLRLCALQADLPLARVEEVLALVDLQDGGRRRVGEYSLGMRQRLGLAGALLGDPEVLILDEPANGLDPEGVRWLRDLLRSFAAEGRTVLVSSHVLAEVAQTVDHVVVLNHGRLVADAALPELLSGTDGAEPALEDVFLGLIRGERPAPVASPAAPAVANGAAPPVPAPPSSGAAPLADTARNGAVPAPAVSATAAAIDDEDELDRRLAGLRWPPTPRVVAVTRAKGGAGCTTVSLALADALTRHGGRRVACVDADPGAGTLLAVAGAGPTWAGGLDDIADDARRIGTAAALARHGLRRRDGCDVFGFPPGEPPSALGPSDYSALLELCTLHYEVVVVDVGGSPLAPLGSMCVSQAQHAVVVSKADALAAAVTANTLQGLDPRRATVVVNGAVADGEQPVPDGGQAVTLTRAASTAPAAAALQPLTAGRPLTLPADIAFRHAPWGAADLSDATRVAVKRLALSVAGELAR